MRYLLAALLCLSPRLACALPKPLDQARHSVLPLESWRFKTDIADEGLRLGWQKAGFDDSRWAKLASGRSWKEQGFKDFRGHAWYRLQLALPASWKGTPVRFRSEGVDSEYELYVNGALVRGFGPSTDIPGEAPTQVDISPFLKFKGKETLAVRVLGAGGLQKRVFLRSTPPLGRLRELLPAPVLDAHPDWVTLYWNTWELAWNNVCFGSRANGMVPAYMDEGYNDDIYQWDSIFMSLYGRYGRRLFPATATLDNFYRKQEPDGYIQRIYSETTGRRVVEPNEYTTMTNPSLFAWAEWEHYRYSGDKKRLAKVFPALERYDAWLKAHQRSPILPELYWSTGFESGMDNMPRPDMEKAGWADISLQQALAARSLQRIARALGRPEREDYWRREFEERKDAVNSLAWSEADGIYYDVDRSKRRTGVRHIGAMWALIADVADMVQAGKLVAHLKDPKEFYRPHLFPALAASDPGYTKTATYWAGGVWAPTDYMTIHGLMARGYEAFAREAALNHIENMAKVYASRIDETHVDPNEADGDYATIWECYAPDEVRPCTRADTVHYGRQDFAGWTGLGPIALLIEQAVGLDIVGAENTVVWRLEEPGRVGLENFEVGGGNIVSLVAEPEAGGKRRLEVSARRPFKLEVLGAGGRKAFDVKAGASALEL